MTPEPMNVDDSTYWIASFVADPDFCQRFLNAVDLEDKKEFVCEVRYLPSPSKYGINLAIPMGILSDSRKVFSDRGNRCVVLVTPLAFMRLTRPNFGDFLSSLIDHEGDHARYICESPDILHPTEITYPSADLRRAMEIRALENQIRNFGRRNCSEIHVSEVRRKLESMRKRSGGHYLGQIGQGNSDV